MDDPLKALPKKPAYEGYFETQREARCAIHALNNCLGRPFSTDDDMEHAVDQLISTASHEGLNERRTFHARKGGWYSSEAIATAITCVSMRKQGKVEYVMSLEPLHKSPAMIHSCVGAIVNVDNIHWVALKSIAGKIWLLDSQKNPRQLSEDEYKEFARTRKGAYPIHWAVDMSKPISDSQASSSHESPVLPLS